MATVVEKTPGRVIAVSEGVELPETLATLIEVPCEDIAFLGLEFAVADEALDQFVVEGKFHRDGDFQVLYNTGFDTPTGLVVGASGDLTAFAQDTSGWLLLNVLPLYAVRVQAAGAATGPAVVTSRAIGKS